MIGKEGGGRSTSGEGAVGWSDEDEELVRESRDCYFNSSEGRRVERLVGPGMDGESDCRRGMVFDHFGERDANEQGRSSRTFMAWATA